MSVASAPGLTKPNSVAITLQMNLQIDSSLLSCYYLIVSESLPSYPTAEELYSSYKIAYSELEKAEHVLPPINQTAAEAIEVADRLISAVDLDIETRQGFLNKLALMKDISMTARLKTQRRNVIVAKQAVNAEIIISQHVYAKKRDEWHAEALLENKAENRQ